jgi:hypothetical protein
VVPLQDHVVNGRGVFSCFSYLFFSGVGRNDVMRMHNDNDT